MDGVLRPVDNNGHFWRTYVSSIYMRDLGQFIKTALDSYAVGARSAPVREAHTHTA